MSPDLIPAVDPAGLPGPVWLFQVLLVLTFFLHLVFMNLTLGGTLLAAVAHALAKGRGEHHLGVFAGRMTAVNGFAISLTITTGIAPLLFMQVLYQQYFYTATILIGWIWLTLLVLLTVGYYAVYLYKFRGTPTRGAGGGVWIWTSAVLFLLIAMIHVAVHLIHAQPGLWAALDLNPWAVLADPTYWPRLLHFVFAGIGFSAALTAWWAVRQAGGGVDAETNGGIARFAWTWLLWTTVLQVADGFLLLLLLPREVLLGLMRGGAATMVPLTVAILLGIGLLMMIVRVRNPIDSPGTVTGVLAAITLTVAVMAVTRHQVRLLYLAPSTELTVFRTAPQWLNFGLFALLLVAGLAVVAYMARKVLLSPATGEDAA